MKKEFSTQWKGSKQPRKQRKFLANAPLNIKRKLLSSLLSKELRKKYGKRNLPIKKGDEIKIMKGEFKGKTGKIETVETKNSRVMIAGIFRTKRDGTKVSVKFHPSNLMIKELNIEDKKRKESLERKKHTKQINKEAKEIKKETYKNAHSKIK